MVRIKTIISSIVIVVQSLIELARKDPEFAEAIRSNVIKAVPKQYKKEADTLLRRVLNIRADIIDLRYGKPYPRKYHARSYLRYRDDGPRWDD